MMLNREIEGLMDREFSHAISAAASYAVFSPEGIRTRLPRVSVAENAYCDHGWTAKANTIQIKDCSYTRHILTKSFNSSVLSRLEAKAISAHWLAGGVV